MLQSERELVCRSLRFGEDWRFVFPYLSPPRNQMAEESLQTIRSEATVGQSPTASQDRRSPCIVGIFPRDARLWKLTKCIDKYNDSTQKYDQDVSVDGKVVSTVSSSQGHHAMGWGTALECTTKPCGTVPAHGEFTPRNTSNILLTNLMQHGLM